MKEKLEKLNKEIEKVLKVIKTGYVVGGTVRDSLLNRFPIKDIDISVENLNENLIEKIKKEFKSKGFTFTKKKEVFTIVTESFKLDVAEVYENIRKDLLLRDFTINAMAVPFKNGQIENFIIDPVKGLKAIEKKLINPVSEENIKEDPIRILRGIRFKNLLNFNYTNKFIVCASKYKNLLQNSPKERVKDELIKMLASKVAGNCIRELTNFEVIFSLIPQLELQKKIPPSGVHQFPLIEHTIRTVINAAEILDENNLSLNETIIKEIKNIKLQQNFTGREILLIAALLHDIGKPYTVKEKNGKLTFYNHDKVGAKIAKDILQSLSFGNKTTKIVGKIVKLHLRPFFLYNLHQNNKLSKKAIYNFLKDSKEVFPFVAVHSIADFKATSEEFSKKVKEYVEFINTTLLENYINLKHMKPLLTGREIMEILNIEKPSKEVGKAKDKLLELQFLEKVKTKEDAIKAVKGFNL